MELLLVPLIGPFHLRSPAYNAVSVRDAVAAWGPDALATTALVRGALDDRRWQDTPEVALPLSVAPWARRRGLPLHALDEPGAEDEAALRRYLQAFPQARAQLEEIDEVLAEMPSLLDSPLTMERIRDVLLPMLREHAEVRRAAVGDGPATGWLDRRMRAAATAITRLGASRVAVLAPVEHLPGLSDALSGAGASAPLAFAPPVTPEARERAVLDYAFRTEVPDPGALLGRLREIAGAEARYHEANLLLAGGHLAEALELLESTSRGDFSEPYFLPGYLLARLGQARDLAGRREAALRAYRAVRALDYAPPEALEAAAEGLRRPFGSAD